MSALILSLLRKTLLQKLRWPFQHANAKLAVAAPGGPAELDSHDDVGCLLYLRPMYRREVREIQKEVDRIEDEIDRTIVFQIAKMQDLPAKLNVRIKDYKAHVHLKMTAPWMARPRQFLSAEWRGERIPVYSLPDLLGEEQMRHLVTGTKFEEVDWVILKRSPLTVQTQMWLLKLHGYFAEGVA